jgi:hypothetical protein
MMPRAVSSTLLAITFLTGCTTFTSPWNARPAHPGVSYHMTTIHDAAAFGEGGRLMNAELTDDSQWLALHPQGSDAAEMASFESSVVRSGIRFNEALLSWNVDVPEGCGVRFDLRVGDTRTGEWTPWMYVGRWGAEFPAGKRVKESRFGRIDVDYFRSTGGMFDVAQYRIIAARNDSAPRENGSQPAPAVDDADAAVRVRRIALTFSDRAPPPPPPQARAGAAEAPSSEAEQAVAATEAAPPHTPAPAVAMDVPFRSQKAEDKEIAGKICSPTSLTMVLAYRGVDEPVATVAARALDEDTGIYGNWPANVQAAYSFGVPGYLTRINDWAQVRRSLARGQPLIASIRAENGELAGAPYHGTDGHLIVIRGLDENGDVLVNDPAARTPEAGVTTYRREDMQRVWLKRGAGTAYVLLPREAGSK